MVPCIGLQSVIVPFAGHTHLLNLSSFFFQAYPLKTMLWFKVNVKVDAVRVKFQHKFVE